MLRNRGIAFKLIALFATAAGIIFLCVFGYAYVFTRRLIEKNVEENAGNLARATANRIEANLRSLQKVPLNAAYFLDRAIVDRTSAPDFLVNLVNTNKEIHGAAVAFEPSKNNGSGAGFAPYAHRSGAGAICTDLAAKGTDYVHSDWYQIPKELDRPEWSEPYFGGADGNTLISTYSVPFYRNEVKGRPMAGVIAVDISLEKLQEIVSSVKVLKTGYAFLISQNGTVVTHPRTALIMNDTIFGMAEEAGDTGLRALGRRMIAGGTGFVPLGPGPLGGRSFMYYAPILSNNWSLAVLFPVDELMADVRRFTIIVSILIVLGLIALSVAAVLIARSITGPLRAMADATGRIAGGDLDAELRLGESEDEVNTLARAFENMRVSLKDHIRKLTETTVAKQRMESELSIAHEIQMSLLPKLFPAFPDRAEFDIYACIEPAKEVGGDFYDFFFVDDRHICLVMADVSGKGVPASLFMAVTKTLIKAKTDAGSTPGEVLTMVNRDLSEGGDTDMFVTVFFAVLDVLTGKVQYANGGHNPPLIIGPGNNIRLVEKTGNLVVGMMDGMEYVTKEFDLLPGDMLLMFTDGVTEAVNRKGEFFGDERLLEEAGLFRGPSPEPGVKALREALERFSEGAPQADDITIMALGYKGPEAGLRSV
jgi:phosphoserine phosphatase RsbU/P